MSPHRDEHLDLCAGHALEILADGEGRELEAHLAEGCATCQAELERLAHGAWLMAMSAPPLKAPVALRGRVLDAVRAGQETPRPAAAMRPLPLPVRARRQASGLAWGWAAAAAVIAVAGVVTWRRAADLETRLAAANHELVGLQQQVEEEKRWAALSTAPGAMVVKLESTPADSAGLVARVTYDPATRRAVVACDHFTAPAGRDYQLWAILAGGPASLGLVRADSTGHAEIRLPDAGVAGSLAAFAVSLEKEGGAPTPNAPAGPVVMVGKIPG